MVHVLALVTSFTVCISGKPRFYQVVFGLSDTSSCTAHVEKSLKTTNQLGEGGGAEEQQRLAG